MCGIIGITGTNSGKTDRNTVESMLSCLKKRGPDDEGSVYFSDCILGQTRLSIIDIDSGHQPMRDNTKNLTIAFNGEIYNYRELRESLSKKGHVFSTNSDTEVILKAFIEYGTDCPSHLDGMFAFLIWNEDEHTLFFARDIFGKKPLYYAFTEDKRVLFASEIKSILGSKLITGIVDPGAIDNYLTLMYVPPWKSVYSNIHVVPPAHSGTYRNGVLASTRYWSMPEKPITTTYDEAKIHIKKLLIAAVKKRMVADVEIGSFLSGGVDSTLVTYFAQSFMNRPIKTFSVGYEHHIDELPFAQQASNKIGTDHYTLQAKGNLVNELKKVIEYMDEPHADSSNFPQHLISEFAAQNVKVALSGDGADEFFMGYGWYWKYANLSLTEKIHHLFSNTYNYYTKNISIWQRKERLKLWKKNGVVQSDIFSENRTTKNDTQKINLFDIHTYLPGQLLTKVDRTSMMHSLEIRSPFLDRDLTEYVYNIPTKYKMDGKQGKIILKDILAEFFTKEFVYRRKQGFGAPIKEWMKQDAFRELIQLNLGPKAHINTFLNQKEIQKTINIFYAGNDAAAYKLWTLLCLELWFKTRTTDVQVKPF